MSASDDPTPARAAPLRVTWVAIAALLVGLVVTTALAWLAHSVNSRNETRLLKLQTEETATVLQVVLPTVQTPLAAAAELASTTGGSPARFHTYLATSVGPKLTFVSATLWRLDPDGAKAVATLGAPTVSTPAQAESLVADAHRSHALEVGGPVGRTQLRLIYAYASAGGLSPYAVEAESNLPPGRRAVVPANSPFADLRFALYVGPSARSDKLLETNAPSLPITGRTATDVVPFGGSSLTLVASPTRQLGGTLSGSLWWIVAIGGTVLSLGAGFTAERLARGRQAAERLSAEVSHLLGEQRTIAETLQQALLPQAVPAVDGVEVAVRYVPGTEGVDIGGDWYDVVPVGPHRFFFTIGDVAGRGVRAGSVMAALHFAIRGFVAEGHPPDRVLDVLARVLPEDSHPRFATVLCGLADVERHEVTFANAGHLPPLLVADSRGEFLTTRLGPPIGVPNPPAYETLTVAIPPRATLLVYTDGLIERRGETLDDGFARLRAAATSTPGTLDNLLDSISADLAHEGHDDDTAILGMRWLT